MRPIQDVANELGINTNEYIPLGKYKAKVPLDQIGTTGKTGDLIVVTGITPTPAGEGKTTTTVGLAQGLGRIGKSVAATLREPSLGPIFGIKGGGTGGGKSIVEPEDEVNIHFTGDAHAVGSAHNLLAALTDNVAQRGLIPGFFPEDITFRRVTDIEERSLRSVITGIGGNSNAPLRESGFDIVTASEIMAILALSSDLNDLRSRLEKVVVGYSNRSNPVTASDVGAVGSMMALLRYAIQPNLVQTTEGQPVLVHTGPFGNIAHGCCSVVADKLALSYADYVLTEAGFGADLGFEKFIHIKARYNDLEPSAVVIVASTRALKSHGGVSAKKLSVPNVEAVNAGMPNLSHLIGVIRSFGLPVVVAINKFSGDTLEEIEYVKEGSMSAGAFAAVESRVFDEGGAGAIELAEALVKACDLKPDNINYMYSEEDSLVSKIESLASRIYNADGVSFTAAAKRSLANFEDIGWGNLPICMAKTHLSLSHLKSKKGLPSDYIFRVSGARASVGAGFIYPTAGNIMTMPGLPGNPRALDVNDAGEILGL
tara:strand:- start:3009 stop:4631 length:1623 start_codon:yes stop_codon:yes gene_type:complete